MREFARMSCGIVSAIALGNWNGSVAIESGSVAIGIGIGTIGAGSDLVIPTLAPRHHADGTYAMQSISTRSPTPGSAAAWIVVRAGRWSPKILE